MVVCFSMKFFFEIGGRPAIGNLQEIVQQLVAVLPVIVADLTPKLNGEYKDRYIQVFLLSNARGCQAYYALLTGDATFDVEEQVGGDVDSDGDCGSLCNSSDSDVHDLDFNPKRPGPGRPKVETKYGEAFLVCIKDNGFELSKSTATNLFLPKTNDAVSLCALLYVCAAHVLMVLSRCVSECMCADVYAGCCQGQVVIGIEDAG